MTVTFKDAVKFFGMAIIACCAVLVCNMFLNYDIDLRSISGLVDESTSVLYDALLLNNKVVCLVAGGCLVLTSVVMLVFYIGQYIKAHSAKFGILKALGQSDFQIAIKCAVFGFCIFLGTALGYALSWCIMPRFYSAQNSGNIGLPEVALKYHPTLLLLIILPTLFFSVLSVIIVLIKLRLPALKLIKGELKKERKIKYKSKVTARPFLTELSLGVLNEKKSLAFFVAFGSFCFSSMLQMGLSMRDYASDMMGLMILFIGMILAALSLFLALSTAVSENAKKIVMLKVNGYSLKQSAIAVLGLYHIPAAVGFAVGTVYQWGLLNIMVNIVFASFDNVPKFSFNWEMFAVCIASFVVIYELLNVVYALIIGKTSIKTIMSE